MTKAERKPYSTLTMVCALPCKNCGKTIAALYNFNTETFSEWYHYMSESPDCG